MLPGNSSGPGRMGSGSSPEELPTGSEPNPGAHRRRQAPIAVVSRADRRLVEAYLSVRRELPRVTRNHLPHALHSSPRRLEQGAPAAFEAHAGYAPFTSSHAENRQSRKNHRHGVHQRAPGRGGRSSSARSLGG